MALPPNYSQSGAYPPPQGFGGPGMYPPQQGGPMYPPQQPGGYPPQGGQGGPPPSGGYVPVSQGAGSGMDSYPPAGAPAMPPMVPRIPLQGGGGFDNPHTDPESSDGWAGASFSNKAIRRAFIKKVYLILMTQLLVTAAFVAFFLFHDATKDWVQRNSWFYWVSYGVFLVTYITLVCCPSVRRSYPANFICLAIFTAAFSYMTGTITSFYDTEIILIAVGITAAVCLAITLFAMQTKFDFTMCGGLLFVGSMVLFFFGIACVIVYSVSGPNYILHCVYAGLAALLFSLFLAYDTQMLMGGKKHELSPEEYIFGALQLYVDIYFTYDTQMLLGRTRNKLHPDEYVRGALLLYLDIGNLFRRLLGVFTCTCCACDCDCFTCCCTCCRGPK